jgi:hypothetical protein
MTTAAAPTALRTLPPDPAPVRSVALTVVPGSAGPDAVAPAAVPRLRLLRHEPDPDGVAVAAPARSASPVPEVPDDLRETVDLRRRAHQVLCLVLEVIDGRRPLAHLAAHLEPPALRYVRAAGGRPTGRRPSRLASLHVSRPCTGAVEVAAVHHAGGRVRAMAARFEGRPDEPARWRCVTVRLL